MKKILLLIFIFATTLSFSANFWEKGAFNISVTETISANKKTKTKKYSMSYSPGKIRLTVSSPETNKGEVYTFQGGKKTIYYPSLKQTVTQNLANDESNILSLFDKLQKLDSAQTQTIGTDKFNFANSKLSSIESKGYTARFSNYKTSGNGYLYPGLLTIKSGNVTVSYSFSNFK